MDNQSRLFSREHVWICMKDEIARIGISDYAQTQLGDIVFFTLPEIGENLEIGEKLGDVESLKTVSDIISPVDGVITDVNVPLMDEPDQINSEPYESWLVEVRVSRIADDLMEDSAYEEYQKQL